MTKNNGHAPTGYPIITIPTTWTLPRTIPQHLFPTQSRPGCYSQRSSGQVPFPLLGPLAMTAPHKAGGYQLGSEVGLESDKAYLPAAE